LDIINIYAGIHEDWATPLGDLNYISVYNELSERALQLVDDKFGRLV